MAYEVDFMAVGDGEKSGDAIALRFGNLAGQRSGKRINPEIETGPVRVVGSHTEKLKC